ncbi:MFS transporter (plasmid) [Streptomyces sp. NBC_00335]|uniref:MFS transporter n=1 Tax=unclassified Streptomyces TaxID=2593676 RepID=UPI00224D982F|nr:MULTISPECIES: MFS transporter [unclassified Streptomyces]MCX5409999.1 MFS transporter [Streptomyces sp. NBC_00086]
MSVPVLESPRARWLAFSVLCSMQLMIVVDISIVTVALRSIQSDLGFDQAHLAWVTNAYTVGFGGLLLLSGRLGDLIGRKRLFISGVSLFTLASAACGLSGTQEMLIAMRFVQGAGAAMAYAVVMGIVFMIFRDDPRQMGKAMGAIGFAAAGGASIGILISGLLTHGASWHWVFYVNVPIGAAAAVLAARLIPDDKGPGLGSGVDLLGAALVTTGMMLGVYTLATGSENGWGSAHTLGFGLGAIVLLVAFVVRQATAKVPLLPLSLFRSRNLSGANLIHLLLVAATISFNIMIALYLQQVVGYSVLVTSFAFVPLALIGGFSSLALSQRLNMRFGARNVLVVSLLGVAAALLLAARVPEDPTYVLDLLPVMLVLGFSGGLAMPAVMMLSMSVQDPRDAGAASGLSGTSGMIGDSLGIAAMTAIAASYAAGALADGESAASAATGGFQLVFGIAAGLVLVAAAVGWFVLPAAQPMPMGEGAPSGPPQHEPEAVAS